MSEVWVKGNYAAVTKAATVYEHPNTHKLLLGVVFDVGGTEMKKSIVLAEADGSLSTVNIGKIREWSGWDGIDPYWFIEAAPTGIEVSVAVEMKPGYKDPTKMYPEINWVNPSGGGGKALPEPTDKRAVLSKWGSKFRAVAGPQPVGAKPQATPATTQKPAVTPPTRPAPRPAPVATAVKHATPEECWGMMSTHYPSLGQDALTEKWYAFVDATGMDQADMTPEGWDKVKAAIMADSFVGDSEPEGCPL